MLVAGNTCDSEELFQRYGIEARCFDRHSLGYLASGDGLTAIASS
jgi:hypothetical protein